MIKRLKIGDKVYSVAYEKDLNYKENVQAQIRYREMRISVEPNQNPQYEIDCIMHEAVHGVLAFMQENDKNNEATVSRIANGLLMLLIDNPELIEQALRVYKDAQNADWENWDEE